MQCKAFNLLLHLQNGNIFRNLNTCIFIQLRDECVLCITGIEDLIQSLVVYYLCVYVCVCFSKESVSVKQSGFHQRYIFFNVYYSI